MKAEENAKLIATAFSFFLRKRVDNITCAVYDKSHQVNSSVNQRAGNSSAVNHCQASRCPGIRR